MPALMINDEATNPSHIHFLRPAAVVQQPELGTQLLEQALGPTRTLALCMSRRLRRRICVALRHVDANVPGG